MPDPAAVSREKFRKERELLRNLEACRRRRHPPTSLVLLVLALLLAGCWPWLRHQVEDFLYWNMNLPPWFSSAARGVFLPTVRDRMEGGRGNVLTGVMKQTDSDRCFCHCCRNRCCLCYCCCCCYHLLSSVILSLLFVADASDFLGVFVCVGVVVGGTVWG